MMSLKVKIRQVTNLPPNHLRRKVAAGPKSLSDALKASKDNSGDQSERCFIMARYYDATLILMTSSKLSAIQNTILHETA